MLLPSGFDQIPTPSGTLVLTAKRFVADDTARTVAAIDAEATVVCLNPERELMQWPHYPMWLRKHQPERALWFSMPDWEAPDLAEALVLLDDVVARLEAGRTVIMHCSHGQGRAGTMAVAVLVLMGHTTDEALSLVAEHRPGAGPNAGSQTSLIAKLADEVGRRG